ncbi:hypothetical protein DY000_02062416 [Brassica cretica]|uniref:Uncharacterized protein n=1 Tax=Brassica cretica TaxID=69181 RepID=A0ABQ7AXZ2_BRACR|nr:hypothetical protein DY000_02062416 [Brassica cretica]
MLLLRSFVKKLMFLKLCPVETGWTSPLLVRSRIALMGLRGAIALKRKLRQMAPKCGSSVRHFKLAGCPLPSLRNMIERDAYVKMAVAHAKAMEANNEFAATLEKRLQDVPRSDELHEIKKVVWELKLSLKLA